VESSVVSEVLLLTFELKADLQFLDTHYRYLRDIHSYQQHLVTEHADHSKAKSNKSNDISEMQEVCGSLIQGVPGGKDLTSGECSLGQTISI
jgi:hypothetical protein